MNYTNGMNKPNVNLQRLLDATSARFSTAKGRVGAYANPLDVHIHTVSVSQGVTDYVDTGAPDDAFRVLYVSEHFDVCMAETIIRTNFNAPNPVLSRSYIQSHSLATVTVVGQNQLNLVDLREPLWPIGGSLEIASTSDYTQPNAWSKAFYDLPADYDGILFPSRYSGLDAIVLFDRVNVRELSTRPLTTVYAEEYC